MISRKGLHDAARTTHTFEVPGQVPVTISRTPRSMFYKVVYGKQICDGMLYGDACAELGRSLMHALGCNGFHDGNPDYSNDGE